MWWGWDNDWVGLGQSIGWVSWQSRVTNLVERGYELSEDELLI